MGNKVRLITPFLMLLAGALASVIMYIKKYDFNSMLWTLLIVLLIFYVIGDIVRYIYALIRPRIIPKVDISGVTSEHLTDDTVANAEAFDNKEGMDISEFMSQEAGEGYSDEDLAEYGDGMDYEGGDGNEFDETQYEEEYEGEDYDDGYTDGN